MDEKNLVVHHNTYWNLINDLVKAAPSVYGLIDQVSEHILSKRYYKALKLTRQLIEVEEGVLTNVL